MPNIARRKRFVKILRYIIIATILATALAQFLDWKPGEHIMTLVALGEATLLGLLVLTIWRARKSWKNTKGSRWTLVQTLLADLMPKALAHYIINEIRLFLAFGRMLFLRKVERSQVLPAFNPLDGSIYRHLFWMILLLILSELPLMYLLFDAFLKKGSLKTAIIYAHAFSCVYFIVWFIGDYRLLLESPGFQIDETELKIDLGIRATGSIPFAAIVATELSEPPPVPLGQSSVKEKDTLTIRLQEKPNILITLQEPVTLTLIFGIERSARRIRLHVPDPQIFLATLERSKGAMSTK